MEIESQEKMMLGSVILDPRVIDACADTLKASHFSNALNKKIYTTMLALRAAGRQVDACAIITTLGGFDDSRLVNHVFGLDSAVATSSGWELYRDRVVNSSRLRSLTTSIRAAQVAIDSASLDDPDQAARDVSALIFAACSQSEASRLCHLGDATASAMSEFEAALSPESAPAGAFTGFDELDSVAGGMKPGELFILAGRPGMGKTTLGLNVALQVADAGAPVLVCSLEMGAAQLGGKVLASMSRQSVTRLREGTAHVRGIERAMEAKLKSAQLPLWIFDDSMCGLDSIAAKARQVQALAGQPLGLIVVDYLQLMQGKRSRGESREQVISQISRGLKVMARDLCVPVMALAQLNRQVESRENKRPLLSDLRDSGAIEQDADQVWFVYREGYYLPDADQNLTELIVAKNRRGQTTTVRLCFDGGQSRFSNWVEPTVRWAG